MRDIIDAPILDLLERIGPSPRPYAETLEASRTSCPHQSVWVDTTDRGLIPRHRAAGRGALVSVSAAGLELLHTRRQP